jgi:hypothetical protein
VVWLRHIYADIPSHNRLQISDAPSMLGAATAWTASESGTPSLNATRTGQVCVCLRVTAHSVGLNTGQAVRKYRGQLQCPDNLPATDASDEHSLLDPHHDQ